MDSLTTQAKDIFEENRYCVLATVSEDGDPWISPVFFAFDRRFDIYWVSNKNSLHSKYMKNHPRIAIVIFDSHRGEGGGDALYIEAEASELGDLEEIS